MPTNGTKYAWAHVQILPLLFRLAPRIARIAVLRDRWLTPAAAIVGAFFRIPGSTTQRCEIRYGGAIKPACPSEPATERCAAHGWLRVWGTPTLNLIYSFPRVFANRGGLETLSSPRLISGSACLYRTGSAIMIPDVQKPLRYANGWYESNGSSGGAKPMGCHPLLHNPVPNDVVTKSCGLVLT